MHVDLASVCLGLAAMQPRAVPVPQGQYAAAFQPVYAQPAYAGVQQVLVPVYAAGQAAPRSAPRSAPPAEPAADREALLHTITTKRLKEGLWSSANCCERCLMVLGGLILLGFCYSSAWDECTHYHRELAVKEAIAAAREEPCTRQGAAALEPGDLLHLYNCSVTGQVHFTSSYPDLQELELFEDNLPSNITGAWFDVAVFYNQRRRGGGWSQRTRVSNVETKHIVAPGVRIGDHSASQALTYMIPGSVVPVKTAATYEYEDTGFFASTPTKLSSKNMKAGDGYLEATDVQVSFSVGNASSVSVLAAADSTGQLAIWNASSSFEGLGGVQINRVEKGAVTFREMLDKTKAAYASDVISWRLQNAGWIWLGTWCLLYAKHVCTCCMARKLQERYKELWRSPECLRCGCSFVWSLLWSLLPTAEVMLLAWSGHRFPLIFLIVGAVFIPCLMCVASGYATSVCKSLCADEDEDAEEDDEEAGVLDAFCNDNIVQIAGILSLSALITTLATSAYIYWVYMPNHRLGAHGSQGLGAFGSDYIAGPVDPQDPGQANAQGPWIVVFTILAILACGVGCSVLAHCLLSPSRPRRRQVEEEEEEDEDEE